ncbi:class I SAM-dependent methyltransferase [Boseongicola sp. H5]|uniref:class I SAM-dependent methyltransferase n=1 Tax=Boseongicola sp. H5 TaxID=2763261 RepID=UPI001D0A0816|nr:class I SAM-dependent methyltransferase [Boseongicola sp. H5]
MSQAETRDNTHLTDRYDRLAGVWRDKMRSLGYYDAYLGFLSSQLPRPGSEARILDIGCGSGAFAEAWAAIHGSGVDITLLDPSAPMLARAEAALARRGLRAEPAQGILESYQPPAPFDHLLAAHVIEHCPDPGAALADMRGLVRTGARLWLVASKPHWCNAVIWLQWRHRTFEPSEVALMLERAGWALDDIYDFPAGPPSRTSRGYLARAI